MADNPYKVVVEALASQSIAIGRLAKEIQVEFAQYQAAQAADDTARAERIAAAINARTEKLSAAADQLAASYPGAVVGGGPAEPPSTPDQGLPSDQPGIDNTLPGRDRPVDPGFGVDEGNRPSTGPVRPGRPTDPDFGVDEGGRPVAPDQPPGRPNRPDQGLPPGGTIDNDLPSGGRPDQGLPPGGSIDNDLPNAPARPGGGPVTPPNRPGQGLPGENPDVPDRPEQGLPPRPGNDLPNAPVRPGGGPVEPGIDNTLPDPEAGNKPVEPVEPEPKAEQRKGGNPKR